MSFSQIESELRTDFSFRNRLQPEHHHTSSLLEELPMDLIKDFVKADPLHLFELGIMKKLMAIWIEGKITTHFKLRPDDKLRLNDAFLKCNLSMPKEIHRSVRSTEWIKFFKGNEFRTILLYVGITVFKNIVHNDAYEHFLYLFCAVTICSTDMYKDYIPLAKILFTEFVEMYIDLYGSDAITINVHNLCHVIENVTRFGNLNQISTYPFENAARHIKLKLKQCNRSLEQVARRIKELTSLESEFENSTNSVEKFIFKFPFEHPNHSDIIPYKHICIEQSVIISSKKQGDKWFLTKSNEIVEFKYAYMHDNKVYLYGAPLKSKESFFDKPFNSIYINIYAAENDFDNDKIYSIDEIKCKMFCSSYESKYVYLPLLHSWDVFK